MKVTFIIRNKTAEFFTGYPGMFKGLDEMENDEKFAYLNKQSFQKLGVDMKIGSSNQFRDRVDLNQILRASKGTPKFEYKIEPRKGYKLATFEIN